MNLPGRPGPLVRWLFRVPALLYRLGLGGVERIVGLRLLRLTTTGRRSGLPRSVMLDVIGEEAGTYYIESAWNERSMWVKNIRANPKVVVQTGRKTFAARAAEVPPAEAAEQTLRFIKSHPWYAPFMFNILGGRIHLRPEEQLRQRLERDCLMFALRPVADGP